MPSPLDKTRKRHNSNKAGMLAAARRLFGEYRFQDTTTRMIAKEEPSWR